VAVLQLQAYRHLDSEMRLAFMRFHRMRLGNHPYVVDLLGFIESPCTERGLSVLMEYAPHGCMEDFFAEFWPHGGDLSLPTTIELLKQMLSGLVHIGRSGIKNYALSPRGILIFNCATRTCDCQHRPIAFDSQPTFHLKIGRLYCESEFRARVSRRANDEPLRQLWQPPISPCSSPPLTSQVNVRDVRYMAPEVFERPRRVREKAQVWSFAVCAWKLLTKWSVPFSHIQHIEDIMWEVRAGVRLEKPLSCPKFLWDVLASCWILNEVLRPSFEVLQEKLSVASALLKRQPSGRTLAELPLVSIDEILSQSRLVGRTSFSCLTDEQKDKLISQGTEDSLNLTLAAALSISEFTVHLPKVHAFFTSHSAWIEPITSFLSAFALSRREGIFIAFSRLVQCQLDAHIINRSLNINVFAQFCILATTGSLLDDITLLDAEVKSQIGLLILVESEDNFHALRKAYAALPDDEERSRSETDQLSETLRWEELFAAEPVAEDAPLSGCSPENIVLPCGDVTVSALVHSPPVFETMLTTFSSASEVGDLVDDLNREPREVVSRRRVDEIMPGPQLLLRDAHRRAVTPYVITSALQQARQTLNVSGGCAPGFGL
jgi:hypothetical protein